VPWPFTRLPFKSRMSRLRYAPCIRSFDIRPLRRDAKSRVPANAGKSVIPKTADNKQPGSQKMASSSNRKSNYAPMASKTSKAEE
jgi:hypothetical protein